MTNRRSVPIGLTIAALCVAFTTACASTTGGASPRDSRSGSGSGAGAGKSSASSAAVSPSGSVAPSTPAASAARGTGTCTVARLAVKAGGSAAGTGNSELVVEITNQGTATCTLSGFPTVTGTLTSGAVVHGTDTTNVFLGMRNPGSGPSPVTLKPGAKAWVPLNFLDNPVNGARSCPSFSAFSITPPGVNHAYPLRAPHTATGYPPDCAGIKVPPVLSTANTVIPPSG